MMRILLFLATNLAVLVIASITLKLLGVDRFTGQNYGSLLVFCAVFGFAGSLVSLFISKWMAKMSTGTEIITQPRTRHEQWLLQTVEELSRQAGIKTPEVGIFPAYEANAFATGWNRNDALVAVSQGLLERFSPDEVKAVLAHEIGHVANGDMVTLSLIQGVDTHPLRSVPPSARSASRTGDRSVPLSGRKQGSAPSSLRPAVPKR